MKTKTIVEKKVIVQKYFDEEEIKQLIIKASKLSGEVTVEFDEYNSGGIKGATVSTVKIERDAK
jgi:hypothetical protein